MQMENLFNELNISCYIVSHKRNTYFLYMIADLGNSLIKKVIYRVFYENNKILRINFKRISKQLVVKVYHDRKLTQVIR